MNPDYSLRVRTNIRGDPHFPSREGAEIRRAVLMAWLTCGLRLGAESEVFVAERVHRLAAPQRNISPAHLLVRASRL